MVGWRSKTQPLVEAPYKHLEKHVSSQPEGRKSALWLTDLCVQSERQCLHQPFHRENPVLINPVNPKVAAVVLLYQPSGQGPGHGNVSAGTGDKPSNAPGLGDIVHRFRVGGGEHQVVVLKQAVKPWERRLAVIPVSLEKHGTL
jgi:hypothetical protein